MVVEFVSCVLAGVLRAALSPSGPGCAKLASNVLWRAVWLGDLSCYGSKRAAHSSRPSWVVLPWRRLSQPDESCAIRPIIAQRKGVGNSLVEVLSGVVRLALIAGVG